MHDSLIRWPEVRAATSLSRTTVWRLERIGQFPLRRKLGRNSVAWLSSEVSNWVATRAVVGGAK